MADWLNSILLRINDGSLLPAAYFVGLDCDAALDSRDGAKDFEAAFIRVSDEVEPRWKASDVAEPLRSLAEDIRRESFLVVSRAAGQHEIASYVSDDFDLIVRARLIGMSNPLLDQLWNAYDGGTFPVGFNPSEH